MHVIRISVPHVYPCDGAITSPNDPRWLCWSEMLLWHVVLLEPTTHSFRTRCEAAHEIQLQGGSHRMLNASDEHLLTDIAQDSQIAFETFYDRHSGAVYALARKILRSKTDSEEVTQDVFFRVWNKAGEYDSSRGTVMAWLMTIAHHTAIDVYRRNQNRQTQELDDAALNAASHGADSSELALDRMMAAKALEMLEESDRSVLEALYFEGLSQSQLAARTGLPLGTLKSRARGALQRLRAQFEELA
jgi:RNA polymerase sigma-70 factor, ECF subfamily